MLDTTLEQLSDGKAVIVMTGSLTMGASLKLLDSQIRQLLEGKVCDLTLDMAGVDYADSGGLGMLVHANGLMKAKQGSLRLTGVRPRVMDLLRLTALDTVISIADGPAAAAPQTAGS
jgi:anti-sigma B factor antagonist